MNETAAQTCLYWVIGLTEAYRQLTVTGGGSQSGANAELQAYSRTSQVSADNSDAMSVIIAVVLRSSLHAHGVDIPVREES